MRSYVYAALFTVMIVLSPRAEAFCTSCMYCIKAPCTCPQCSSGGCDYCNVFGCNCEPCGNLPFCPFATDKTKTDADRTAAATAGRKRFEEMDRNHDHAVNLAELKRWLRRHPKFTRGAAEGMSPETIMKRTDTDGDGSISPAEAGFV